MYKKNEIQWFKYSISVKLIYKYIFSLEINWKNLIALKILKSTFFYTCRNMKIFFSSLSLGVKHFPQTYITTYKKSLQSFYNLQICFKGLDKPIYKWKLLLTQEDSLRPNTSLRQIIHLIVWITHHFFYISRYNSGWQWWDWRWFIFMEQENYSFLFFLLLKII